MRCIQIIFIPCIYVARDNTKGVFLYMFTFAGIREVEMDYVDVQKESIVVQSGTS